MSEVSIAKSRASVMLYNNEKKAWEPAEGIRGMSYVQVYHHEGNNTYRIVGRSMTDHQIVVINCSIVRNLKYNAATPTFHQWRDQRQVYGLNFHSKDDAGQFKEAIDSALEELSLASQPGKPTTQTPQYVPQSPQNWKNRYTTQNNDHQGDEAPRTHITETTVNQDHRKVAQEPANVEKPKVVSSSVNVTPAVPTPPSAPSVPQPPAAPPTPPAAPAVPAAPPAPPGGGGGVPVPPPPPPPPAAGGGGAGGAGGSLAAQIATAKLKKAEAKPEPKPSGGSGGGGSGGAFGGDMMAEMQRKLAARKAKDGSEEAVPKMQVDARNDRLPPVNKIPVPKTNHVTHPPAVAPSVSKTSTLRQERPSNNSESLSSGQLQELKNEILAEFRKELDTAKADIIQAMRQELSRTR